jgi:hypothetical protein
MQISFYSLILPSLGLPCSSSLTPSLRISLFRVIQPKIEIHHAIGVVAGFEEKSFELSPDKVRHFLHRFPSPFPSPSSFTIFRVAKDSPSCVYLEYLRTPVPRETRPNPRHRSQTSRSHATSPQQPEHAARNDTANTDTRKHASEHAPKHGCSPKSSGHDCGAEYQPEILGKYGSKPVLAVVRRPA